MLDLSTLSLFIAGAAILLVTPGPAVLYIVARSIEQGRLAGVISVLGIGIGGLFHVAAAALGISALLASSAVAFSLVKYAGAAYLIYLGIRTLMKKPPLDVNIESANLSDKGLWRAFYQGIVVQVLNPKSALFFLAFLPQFVDPARGSATVQIILLGLIFVVMAIVSDGVYALLAGTVGSWLKQNRGFLSMQRYLTGSTYIALGVATAVSGRAK